MRIIAGSLGGRNFEAPKGHKTHPMSEKARGGLFAALGDISGMTVLDPFAGSGAISFEAISRGAKYAIAIDIDKSAINTVVKTAKTFKIESNIKAIRANASGWSDNNPEEKFDLVICDPPYDSIKLDLLQKLAKHLDDDGIFILSWPGKLAETEFKHLKIIKTKSYGDAKLVFYKKIR